MPVRMVKDEDENLPVTENNPSNDTTSNTSNYNPNSSSTGNTFSNAMKGEGKNMLVSIFVNIIGAVIRALLRRR